MASKDIWTDKCLSYDFIADKLMTTTSRARAKARARGILDRMALVESASDCESLRTVADQQRDVPGLD